MSAHPISAFSCFTASEAAVVDHYAAAFAGAVTKRIVDAQSPAYMHAKRDDAFACIQRAGAACWNPTFGTANFFAKQGASSGEPAVGQLFLALAELGFEGEFAAVYQFPVSHRVRGRRLPLGKDFRCRAASGVISIVSEDRSTTIDLSDELGMPETSPGLFGSGFTKWGYAVDPLILEPEDVPLDCASVDGSLALLQEARNLINLDQRASEWCSRLLRELSLTRSRHHLGLTSRSSPLQPGNIQMSVPGTPVHLGELIVHEASHQHYYLAALAGAPIAPQSRDVVAYSALRNCERPVDRILLGLHALLNIAEFLAIVADLGGKAGAEAAARINELAPTIRSMMSPFALNPSVLSETGRGLLGDGLSRLDCILERFAEPVASALSEKRA